MSPAGLTLKQHELLIYVRGYIALHGASPSYREMMEGVGLRSLGGIHRLVHGLVERGHLVRLQGQSRSLALTERSAA